MFPIRQVCRNLQKVVLSNAPRVRTLAAEVVKKDGTESDNQPKYFQGRRVVEEVDDPFKLEHVLLTITGYDAAILDSYIRFVHTAANMTDLNVTKSFSLAAIPESLNVKKADSQLRKDQMLYKLKRHQRIVQVADVTEDKVDIFVDYIQEHLPCGVQIEFELKRWEELIAPNHPSLQKTEKSVSRYQKN